MSASDLYTEALEKAQAEVKKPNPDFSEVAELLQRAAADGSGDAYYALGAWYLHGRHYEKDADKAKEHWEEASELGNTDAMVEMGKFYENGELTQIDLAQSFAFYLRAALHGSGEGCFEVSRFFCHGFFVPEDRSIAYLLQDESQRLGYEPTEEDFVERAPE